MAGPMGKNEFDALSSIKRDPKTASTVDEGVMRSLTRGGMVKERPGKVELTARGRMTIARKASVTRSGPRR